MPEMEEEGELWLQVEIMAEMLALALRHQGSQHRRHLAMGGPGCCWWGRALSCFNDEDCEVGTWRRRTLGWAGTRMATAHDHGELLVEEASR